MIHEGLVGILFARIVTVMMQHDMLEPPFSGL